MFSTGLVIQDDNLCLVVRSVVELIMKDGAGRGGEEGGE